MSADLAAGGVLVSLGGDVAVDGTPPRDGWPVTVADGPDPAVSRWLWLIKWLLVIPHVVVLFFLWCAASVLTVVAACSPMSR